MGQVQGGFRRGMRTEDNLFMIEMLIEMVTVGKNEMFVDLEKAYDRVNSKKTI